MVGLTPKRCRMSRAMPCACSWSMAMTRPPALGCWRRMPSNWAWASARTLGSHWPSSDNAVRNRWLARWKSRASSNDAENSEPSGATHSMCPPNAGK